VISTTCLREDAFGNELWMTCPYEASRQSMSIDELRDNRLSRCQFYKTLFLPCWTSGKIVDCLSLASTMFVEREVGSSALFTFLVGWHTNTASLSPGDIILGPASLSPERHHFLFTSGISNLSLCIHWASLLSLIQRLQERMEPTLLETFQVTCLTGKH